MTVMRELLGDVAWARWYAAAAPEEATVVPRQLACLVHMLLCHLKIELESSDAKAAIVKRAAEGYETMRATAKRLRPTPAGSA